MARAINITDMAVRFGEPTVLIFHQAPGRLRSGLIFKAFFATLNNDRMDMMHCRRAAIALRDHFQPIQTHKGVSFSSLWMALSLAPMRRLCPSELCGFHSRRHESSELPYSALLTGKGVRSGWACFDIKQHAKNDSTTICVFNDRQPTKRRQKPNTLPYLPLIHTNLRGGIS